MGEQEEILLWLRTAMKPKPFRGSNHLTFPVLRRAIALIEMARVCMIGAATRATVVSDLTKENMIVLTN